MGFLQIQALGYAGRDPEMSYTPDGLAVTRFSLGVSEKTKTGETTTWLSCTAFRGLAETINEHVRKGTALFIQGTLKARTYTTRDGLPAISLDVVIEKFSFAGAGTGAGKENGAPASAPSAPATPARPQPATPATPARPQPATPARPQQVQRPGAPAPRTGNLAHTDLPDLEEMPF